MKIMDFFRGQWVLKAEGVFSERIINITKENGIFIRNIMKTDEKSLIFTISYKGALKLFSLPLPEDVTLTVYKRKGLPAILQNNKKRYFLFISPFIILTLLFLSTQIIWHVNVIGADGNTEELILSQLKELGLKRGTFKFTIDQADLKNTFLIKNEQFQWIWVDIKGGTAIVKFSMHTPPPKVFDKDTFYNIYSTEDATVTKIIAKYGNARVNVGDTVFKGQLLIEGKMPFDAENFKYVHAAGEVFGTVWREKTFSIPKKTEIRTPTGNKKEYLSINFLNFSLKLFINSSILYQEYDIIEDNRSIVPFNICFNKKTYHEVTLSYKDNNTEVMMVECKNQFVFDLEKEGAKVEFTETFTSDNGDFINYTVRALCEVPIAGERRMDLGENYSVTDS